MTLEMTIAAASSGPRRRSSAGRTRAARCCEEGKTPPCDELLREQLAWNVNCPISTHCDELCLANRCTRISLELAVLEHVGARLGRIAGVTGVRTDGQRRGLVAVERDALQEHFFPIFFRWRDRPAPAAV